MTTQRASPDWRAGLAAIANEPANKPVAERFVRFAAGMAIAPLVVYFATWLSVRKFVPAGTLPSGITAPIVAGIAAVLTINMVMGVFALLAVREQVPASASSSAANLDEDQVDEITEITEDERKKDK